MAGKFQQIVSTVFTAKDRISGKFDKMGRSADKFGNKAEKSFRKASRSAKKFEGVTKGILKAQVIAKGFQLLSSGVSSAAVEFANFDQSIISASAKFKGLDLTTKEGLKTFNRLKKSARDVGGTTEFNAAQAAQGLDFLALAGFDAEQAMAALPGTVNLATAAGIDLGTATDIATDSLGAFGLMTKDSAKLQENLTRVNDVMAKTMATSNTSIVQLFEAVKKGAAEFTNAGQSIETFSALAGTMANAGVKGEEAGSQLRNAMIALNKPTKEAGKALKRLGVNVADSLGNTRDIVDIFEDLQIGLKKVRGSSERGALVTTIFAKRSAGLKIILSSNIKTIRKYRQALIDSNGAAQKMADIIRGSLINKLKNLSSALLEASFKIFDAFEIRGKKGIDGLTEAIREFDVQPIIDGIEKTILVFEDLMEIITPIIDGIKWLASTSVVQQIIPGRSYNEHLDRRLEAKRIGLNREQMVTLDAPNREAAKAKAQMTQFTGMFSFDNAPAGMSFNQGKGPRISTSGLGQQ